MPEFPAVHDNGPSKMQMLQTLRDFDHPILFTGNKKKMED